ncbi:MAG: low molecular weight protein arginine phosphatase [Oscillospiraceae bacterium]|nr:low molecular weight protein arginine phosphatase [Oscillospiraceae bacterium]
MNILFVCTGNTCRSPMAAAIMDKIAAENDLDVFIESAGIFAADGEKASDNAVEALKKFDIDLSGHRTQPVTEDLLKQSDVILTMTEGHKALLEQLAPGKVFTLLEYAGSSGDISDPYGGDLEEYEETASEIYDALVDVAEKLPIVSEKSEN